MASDVDRNVVRETLEALDGLNKKLVECRRLNIEVELIPRNLNSGYSAEFKRTEIILPPPR